MLPSVLWCMKHGLCQKLWYTVAFFQSSLTFFPLLILIVAVPENTHDLFLPQDLHELSGTAVSSLHLSHDFFFFWSFLQHSLTQQLCSCLSSPSLSPMHTSALGFTVAHSYFMIVLSLWRPLKKCDAASLGKTPGSSLGGAAPWYPPLYISALWLWHY